MIRSDGRSANQLRPFAIEYGIQPHAAASLLVSMGRTQVICAVTVEPLVPSFLQGKEQGWITAEYAMLPCATHSRGRRQGSAGPSGRSQEIQRLIGRSLRMMVDLRLLGQHTLRIDCDVLNADGGTRCASITGAALALRQAILGMAERGMIAAMPPLLPIAAVSVGIIQGQSLLDLSYAEDSVAEVDANFVMSADGRWLEAQSTAEGAPFTPQQFESLSLLASDGISELLSHWHASMTT